MSSTRTTFFTKNRVRFVHQTPTKLVSNVIRNEKTYLNYLCSLLLIDYPIFIYFYFILYYCLKTIHFQHF